MYVLLYLRREYNLGVRQGYNLLIFTLLVLIIGVLIVSVWPVQGPANAGIEEPKVYNRGDLPTYYVDDQLDSDYERCIQDSDSEEPINADGGCVKTDGTVVNPFNN